MTLLSCAVTSLPSRSDAVTGRHVSSDEWPLSLGNCCHCRRCFGAVRFVAIIWHFRFKWDRSLQAADRAKPRETIEDRVSLRTKEDITRSGEQRHSGSLQRQSHRVLCVSRPSSRFVSCVTSSPGRQWTGCVEVANLWGHAHNVNLHLH